MPSTQEVAYSIFGAFRLAMLDRTGMSYFDQSANGALRSFQAAVVILPAFILLQILSVGDKWEQISLLRFAVVQGIAYVLTWTVFAVAMIDLTKFLGRSDRYFGFLCAFNWSNVILIAVYLPAIAIDELGLLPNDIEYFIIFLVALSVLLYQWFVTYVSLDLPPMTALCLVFIDRLLVEIISASADRLVLVSTPATG